MGRSVNTNTAQGEKLSNTGSLFRLVLRPFTCPFSHKKDKGKYSGIEILILRKKSQWSFNDTPLQSDVMFENTDCNRGLLFPIQFSSTSKVQTLMKASTTAFASFLGV